MSQERAFKTSALTDVNRNILDAARESISTEHQVRRAKKIRPAP